MEKNLFENLAASINCTYITDLKFSPFNGLAKEILSNYFVLEEYTLKDLSDMYEYLYGEKKNFTNYNEAKAAFGQ